VQLSSQSSLCAIVVDFVLFLSQILRIKSTDARDEVNLARWQKLEALVLGAVDDPCDESCGKGHVVGDN
jgi:hypothetical protein